MLRGSLLAAVAAAGLGLAPAAHAVKHVLLLFPYEDVLPTNTSLRSGLSEVLRDFGERVEVYSEFLDSARFPGPDSEQRMARFLDEKYSGIHIDLLVTIGEPAYSFIKRNRAALFPEQPWIIAGVRETTLANGELPSNAVGVLSHFDSAGALELALALQPEAREAIFVSGASALDRRWVRAASEQLRDYGDRLRITYLAGETVPRLLERLGKLPRDTIVIYQVMSRDGDDHYYVSEELVGPISAASNAPVYGVFETYMGGGIVGGAFESWRVIGAEIGRTASSVLAGAQTPLLATTPPPTFTVDWRQLERWNLDEGRLPAGTTVLHRQPSAWEQHKRLVLVISALVAVQALLIVTALLHSRKVRAERALRRSEERYRNVVEAQTDLVCRYSPDGTLTFVNEAYCRAFGRSREELIGTRYTELLPEHERLGALRRLRSLVDRPRTDAFVHHASSAGGSPVWRQWVDQVILDEHGRAAEIQGIGRDITQLKLAEHEALQRREQVTHLARVAILGELSGALAHELNQPLAAIISNAQAAQRLLAYDPPDLPLVREILEDIVADDKRAGEVIARLRALLRKDSARLELVDVGALVTDVLAFARRELVERHIAIRTRFAADLPPVLGDRVQIQQILLNLLLNAAEAMSGNEPNDRLLAVSTHSSDNRVVRVEIADSGSGIVPEAAGRLFEPFFTTKKDGLGLGLSICSAIAGAHGGHLVARNNPDRGATFTLTLPQIAAATSADGCAARALSG